MDNLAEGILNERICGICNVDYVEQMDEREWVFVWFVLSAQRSDGDVLLRKGQIIVVFAMR